MAKSSIVKGLLIFLVLALLVGGGVGYYFYEMIYGSNIRNNGGKDHVLFIPTGADFDDVRLLIKQQDMLKNDAAFLWVAEKMKYPENVKPGKYLISSKLTTRELVDKLRQGKNETVKVVINSARTLPKIAGAATANIEADSTRFLQLLTSKSLLDSLKKNEKTVMSLIMPDTYQLYWNTNERRLLKRLLKEYDKFWSNERIQQAKALNLTPYEVITLASIVEQETYHHDEMDDVAGVYLNRLKKGMLLQADPTVKYAVGDFELKRVLNKHLEFDSPYNTYKYAGLPPGPICVPSKKAINAVLNPMEHKYLYFCAKDDFSMYHAFATTLRQHTINARRYQSALNRKRIF